MTCRCQELWMKLCTQHKKARHISTSVRNSISASKPFSKSRSCSFGRCSNSWDPRDCWGSSSGNSLITSYGSENSNLVLNRMCYKSHQPHTLTQMHTCTHERAHTHTHARVRKYYSKPSKLNICVQWCLTNQPTMGLKRWESLFSTMALACIQDL